VGEPVILTWSVENSLLTKAGGGELPPRDKRQRDAEGDYLEDLINRLIFGSLDSPGLVSFNSFNNLIAKMTSLFIQPTIAQTTPQPIVFLLSAMLLVIQKAMQVIVILPPIVIIRF